MCSLYSCKAVIPQVLGFFSYQALACDGDELSNTIPYVQTLRTFPKEELLGKVVMVRFDSAVLLLENHDWRSQSFSNAVFTIKYLLEARARVLLVSNWNKMNSRFHDLESVAGIDFFKKLLLACSGC